MRLHSAWWTTRSRKGAAEIRRRFGIVDSKRDVRTRAVGVRKQFILELEEVVLQAVLEGRHRRLAALAFGGAAIGEAQVIPGAEFVVHIQ